MSRAAASTRRTAWACLAIHMLAASGLPLPLGPSASPDGRGDPAATARLAAKDRSAAFPCMDKPCGCATAEQCFTACCCNTPIETLAWARAHVVAPAVLAALERRAAAAPPRAVGDTGGCCAATASCPDATATPPDREPAADTCCCADEAPVAAATGEPSRDDDHDDPSVPAPKRIVLRAMMACGGITAGWWACGPSLPAAVAITIAAPRPAAIVTLADESPISLSPAPDAPPPRAA